MYSPPRPLLAAGLALLAACSTMGGPHPIANPSRRVVVALREDPELEQHQVHVDRRTSRWSDAGGAPDRLCVTICPAPRAEERLLACYSISGDEGLRTHYAASAFVLCQFGRGGRS